MPRKRRRRNNNPSLLLIILIFGLGVYYLWTGADPLGIFTAARTAVPDLGPVIPPAPPITTVTPPGPPTSPTFSPAGWELYFTDPVHGDDPARWQDSVEGRLIDRINAARRSIHVAAFEFDLTRVTQALIAARQRGVDVRWVTDDEFGLEADEEPGRGQFQMLEEADIAVRSDARSGLMHNKFWIFDGEIVWTGSTNVTESGVFRQNNNVLVFHSAELAALYEREFQEMWDGQFGPGSPSHLNDQVLTLNGSQTLLMFAPEDSPLEGVIIPVVREAQQSIRFLAFSFTDYPLAQAMVERSRSGVDVAGVFERVGSETDAAELDTLHCAGVPVRRDGNPGFMHHKVIIVDQSVVITGSMNYSTGAETGNDENVIIIENPEIAALYLREFEQIWGLAEDPDPAQFPCS